MLQFAKGVPGHHRPKNGDFTQKKMVISPTYGCDLNVKNGDVTINNAGLIEL